MAIKTFTTGEVLTASDTNTYLANAGLVYVSSGSFTGATSFEITGFSSTYQYYRVLLTGYRADAVGFANLNGQLMNGATLRNTAYYEAAYYVDYLGASGGQANSNNAADFHYARFDSSERGIVSFDMRGFTSGRFSMTGTYWDVAYARQVMNGAFHNVTETNDRLKLTVITAGATVTGTWRVFGYREP
jgi:hypothetical protein